MKIKIASSAKIRPAPMHVIQKGVVKKADVAKHEKHAAGGGLMKQHAKKLMVTKRQQKQGVVPGRGLAKESKPAVLKKKLPTQTKVNKMKMIH